MRKKVVILLVLFVFFLADARTHKVYATNRLTIFSVNTPNVRVTSQSTGTADQTAENRLLERERLFRRIETLYGIPWYFLAAIDQFERNVRNSRRDLPDVPHEQLLAVQLPTEQWVGLLNPLKDDTDPHTIRFFGGIGADGDGDGLAQRESETDALYALILYLQTYGVDWLSLRTAVWDLYKHPSAVDTVSHIATIYRAMQTMNVQENHFPVSLRHNYTYRSTWGATRGWGGRRIHEGTDIFAHHGTPVYSTCYGYVEAKGWNKYGGWRLGIRDVHNNYHYFAHLGSFDKAIRVGKVVRPGELIGYVGNSGYGPPGTAGKFPPHLHYGMYKFNGKTEWSFDPYPYLRVWEKETRQKKRTQQYQ